MRALTVDTTTERITLGLYNNGKKTFFKGECGCKKHNSVLLNYIDDFLASNGLKASDIDFWGVCVGPGSFTGIRIGVSTVNALCMALGKKAIEITSLEGEDDGTDKLVILDCGHGNYYAAIFGKQNEYLSLSEIELQKFDIPIVRVVESDPIKLLNRTLIKISAEQFVEQARPFYLKKSSAERKE